MAIRGEAILAALLSLPVHAASPSIRVVFLGTGAGPTPNAERAGPAALVETGGERFLVDAGRAVVLRMAQAGVNLRDVPRVFLTHLHSDHVVGLPDVWLSGWWTFREAPLEVTGPAGTAALAAHLREAFAEDVRLRTIPPESLAREAAALVGLDVEEGRVFARGGVTVTAIRVDHGPVPAFGYRVDFGGRSVVFAGDTRKSDNLIAKSQGVDVLIHPMLGFTPEQLAEQTRGGARRRAALQLLPPPEDVAEVFTRSHCKVAVLSHNSREPAALARLRKGYAGRLEQADDLTELLIGDEVTLRTLVR